MRLDDDLVAKALSALDESAARARSETVAPDSLLRFVLAFLHAAIPPGRRDRGPFDAMWRAITRGSPSPARQRRVAEALRAIRAQIDAPDTQVGATPRDAMLAMLRDGQTADRHQQAWDLRGKACPIQRPMRDRWPGS
ncbi:hypothetical protein [uncultured Sphingomonas sp.]|uniref:hypothetical protein n=1 Tax=uncultured Sphingomonas sp. TaxID=158754 RepID=UPI00259899B8|nr:hypothetical protein [uncultured Sphingomonas sp.]